jgi:threonyl-tRNA synthetase
MVIYNALCELFRELGERYGYQEVRSPLVCSSSLWERSGHEQKFGARMFHLEVDERAAALKPMNCPAHAELYAFRRRSYRDLPIRFSELGQVHRLEQFGELNGLLRARSFVIDDAHVFCAPDQVPDELRACLKLARELYELFDLPLRAELSLRPQDPLGPDELWDLAEASLRASLREAGLPFEERPGEGAFYGPKVDLHVSDSLGRSWQMGSVQLDYQLPERFDLRYVAADGRDHAPDGAPYRPVMVHRAMFGSLERLIAILLEHLDGWLPLWLAPEAVRVLPLGEQDHDAACRLAEQFRRAGIRAVVVADGPLSGRIREAFSARVPALAIIGPRERERHQVALRRAGHREHAVIRRRRGGEPAGRPGPEAAKAMSRLAHARPGPCCEHRRRALVRTQSIRPPPRTRATMTEMLVPVSSIPGARSVRRRLSTRQPS